MAQDYSKASKANEIILNFGTPLPELSAVLLTMSKGAGQQWKSQQKGSPDSSLFTCSLRPLGERWQEKAVVVPDCPASKGHIKLHKWFRKEDTWTVSRLFSSWEKARLGGTAQHWGKTAEIPASKE